jgi:ubiquitin-like-conjugating enzyme ATG3
VYKCPTWSWEPCTDSTKLKKYLPQNKQFLMTRNVPCGARVSSMENVVVDVDNNGRGGRRGGGNNGSNDDADDDDGDWLVSRILTAEEQRKRDEDALEQEFDILDDEGEVMKKGKGGKNSIDEAAVTRDMGQLTIAAVNNEDDDEYADMADFEDENVMEDEAAVVVATSSSPATATNASSANNTASIDDNNNNDNILKVRSYDVSITYDKYYQTPRVWLSGYADDGTHRPLTGQEIMEDVISDYAHRTVTMEYHPHLSGSVQHASIHPCQHGAVMKTIIKNLMRDCDTTTTKHNNSNSSSSGPSVENYLFIFLKFVSSMIPTISYDFTVDVSASTRK